MANLKDTPSHSKYILLHALKARYTERFSALFLKKMRFEMSLPSSFRIQYYETYYRTIIKL